MYQLVKDQSNVVRRLSDGAGIPFDPQNSDYIAFLKWIEEGNVVLPADEDNNG